MSHPPTRPPRKGLQDPWRLTFAANAAIFGAGFLGGVLAARLLGVEDRGLLAAIIYWPHFLTGMASLGLNEAIVIYTARHGVTRSLRSSVVALSLSLSIVVVAPGLVLLPWLMGQTRHASVPFARWYFLAFVPASFLAMNLLAIDQGQLAFRSFNAQRTLQAIAYPGLLVVCWAGGFLSVQTAALSVLAGTLLVAWLRLWKARAGLAVRPHIWEARKIIDLGWRLHFVNVFTHLAVQVDKMALILFGGNATLGLYVAAQTAGGAMQSLVVQTYTTIMLPTATGHLDRTEIGRSLRQLSLLLLLATAALIAALPWLVPLLFGEAFAGATMSAQLLAGAAFFAGLRKALTYLLRSQGINRPSAGAEAVVALGIGLGAYPAIATGGAAGLAALVLSAQSVGLVVMWSHFTRRTECTVRDLLRG